MAHGTDNIISFNVTNLKKLLLFLRQIPNVNITYKNQIFL